MYSATLIAKAFVQKAIEDGNPITQMQLQKMVYFAQGYHLVKYGEPLIREEIQAWKFGPVIPGIYDIYKLYGSQPIMELERITPFAEYTEINTLDDQALDSISFTWKATKHLSASAFSNWTHNEGSPWHQTYKPNDYGLIISKDVIKNYFENFLIDENPAAQ